MKKVRLLKKFL